MEIGTPEHRTASDSEPLRDPLAEEDASKGHKRRSSSEKHRDKDAREGKPSKHKHKHHRHKHRRKHRKEHADDETVTGQDDDGCQFLGSEDGEKTEDVRYHDIGLEDAKEKEDSKPIEAGASERRHSGETTTQANFLTDIHNSELHQPGSKRLVPSSGTLSEPDSSLNVSERQGQLERAEVPVNTPIQNGNIDFESQFARSDDTTNLFTKSDKNIDEDEKEEGEILDDEEIILKGADSDAESGEIQTGERKGAKMSLTCSKSPMQKVLPVEESEAPYFKQEQGERVFDGAPVLHSIQSIAEAYDSESGSEDNLINKQRAGVSNCCESVKDDFIHDTPTSPSPTKLASNLSGRQRETDNHSSKRQKHGSRSFSEVDDDDRLVIARGTVRDDSKLHASPPSSKISKGSSSPDVDPKVVKKRKRSMSPLDKEDKKEHSPSGGSKQSVKAQEEGKQELTASITDQKRHRDRDPESKQHMHARDGQHRDAEVVRRLKKNELDQGESNNKADDSKDSAGHNHRYKDSHENRERGRRSRSREDFSDSKHGKYSIDNIESRRAKRSRSRENVYDSRNARDRQDRRGRRSRSREADYRSRSVHDSLQGRQSQSNEGGGYKFTKGSSEKDSRRSRSRETGLNERSRRSKSREPVRESKHSVDVGSGVERARQPESRHTRDNRAEPERRRSKSRDALKRRGCGEDRLDRKRSPSRDHRDRRSPSRDHRSSLDRRRRSLSRDLRDGLDRRRRSLSRDRRDGLDRKRRRSLSRDGSNSLDRRRRSLSRDYISRRRRSRSRESLRERKDERDRRRRSRSKDGFRDYRVGGNSQQIKVEEPGLGSRTNHISKDIEKVIRMEEDEDEHQESVALQPTTEEDDVEKIKEESRKRRQAILEKYKVQQQPSTSEQIDSEGAKSQEKKERLDSQMAASPFGDTKLLLAENGVLDADDSKVESASFDLGKGPHDGTVLLNQLPRTGGLGEGTPKSEKSNDMFCDYIFGDSPAGGRKLAKGDGLALETSGLTDNWDDAEGYYCYRIGEVLDGRFEVAASHGRGVFSSVVRARDLKATRGEPEEVAIKIIRSNELMFKSGQQEHVILKKLAGADPENKRHCVRFLSSFEYRNHLCLVFESLHMNLREILKKFGRNIGINLHAVRAYAKQLFIALKHLRNCGVLHCDIKPDNMLVNEAKNVLKLCDFGSAMFAGENEITPYLVSRFYRAPEIILGLPYDHALDMWSVGCCLYEFYTGKVLFPGPTNNDMLRLHMELKGPFPKKMLKKAGFVSKHFDQDYNFCAVEEDPVTKTTVKRVLVNVKPKDIGSLITGTGTTDEDQKLLANFKDLLEKIFILDPDKRITVSQALNHPFIHSK